MNIRHYIPYYIGQKIRYLYQYEPHYVEWTEWDVLGEDMDISECLNHNVKEVQLALRKLEDMSDEEAFDLCQFEWPVEPTRYIRSSKGIVVEFRRKHPDPEFNNADGYTYSAKAVNFILNQWSPLQFHSLLSRGFDLFGLIPAGLAIDAKTLKTPNNGDKGQ